MGSPLASWVFPGLIRGPTPAGAISEIVQVACINARCLARRLLDATSQGGVPWVDSPAGHSRAERHDPAAKHKSLSSHGGQEEPKKEGAGSEERVTKRRGALQEKEQQLGWRATEPMGGVRLRTARRGELGIGGWKRLITVADDGGRRNRRVPDPGGTGTWVRGSPLLVGRRR